MGPEQHFLQDYQVHKKPEAIQAARMKEKRTGEKGIVTDDGKRIEAYIERLADIFDNPDQAKAESRQQIFKEKFLYPAVLLQKENFPDSYFDYQAQQHQERGLPKLDFSAEQKEQEMNEVIESQRLSLDAWLDYLTGDDCKYPNDIKYFAMQGVLKLAKFDTANYTFGGRSKDTTAPFAEIDREALSIVLGAMDAKHHHGDTSTYPAKLLELIDANVGFGVMYAETMKALDEEANKGELLPITAGEWKIFPQDSDPQALVDSLAGKRSNLCIADIGAATRYLKEGSVEVYFSHDDTQQAVIPRVALASSEKRGLYEVRGTYNKNEDTDPFIDETDILAQKVKDFSNGESFLVKDRCVKELAAIYKKCFKVNRKTGEKTYLNPTLTKQELTFLYEIDDTIQGFGYGVNDRIKEIRNQRNIQEDMLIIFDCTQAEVATNKDEINENTRAYLGPWNTEVFQVIRNYPSITYFYEDFPDKKIFLRTLETDPSINSPEKAKQALEAKNIVLMARNMLEKTEFSQKAQNYELVKFTIEQLGFSNGATFDEVYQKAASLGLELCPAEVGPQLRLQYTGKEGLVIAMKPMIDFSTPKVFKLTKYHNGDEKTLYTQRCFFDERIFSLHFVFVWHKPDLLAA